MQQKKQNKTKQKRNKKFLSKLLFRLRQSPLKYFIRCFDYLLSYKESE